MHSPRFRPFRYGTIIALTCVTFISLVLLFLWYFRPGRRPARHIVGTGRLIELIELGSLLHQFDADGFELVGRRQMRAVARRARAALRKVAHVGRIGPAPGVRGAGIARHVGGGHGHFAIRKVRIDGPLPYCQGHIHHVDE